MINYLHGNILRMERLLYWLKVLVEPANLPSPVNLGKRTMTHMFYWILRLHLKRLKITSMRTWMTSIRSFRLSPSNIMFRFLREKPWSSSMKYKNFQRREKQLNIWLWMEDMIIWKQDLWFQSRKMWKIFLFLPKKRNWKCIHWTLKSFWWQHRKLSC